MSGTPKAAAPRILVVDDDPASLNLMKTLFEEEGMAVVAATSVQSAREQLQEHQWQFDLVVSDISMPKETGFDLLQWLKEQDAPNPDLQVILITAAKSEVEDRILGLSLGAVDYIVRPIDLKELVIRVVHALANAQRVKRLRSSLENSENLAMVGRLLAASTHEIKNLAGIIALATDQLSRMDENLSLDDPRGKKALDVLRRSSGMLAKVVRESGRLLEPQQHDYGPINLSEAIEDVATMIRTRLKMIDIEVATISDDCEWVKGNEIHIKQILINFMLNSGEAIAELEPEAGGHIALTINEMNESQIIIAVSDNGIGLQTAGQCETFSAFNTTKSMRGGQGLGLWYCDRLAQNMGGSIKLKSKGPGLGATASLILCKAEKPEAPIDISSYLID